MQQERAANRVCYTIVGKSDHQAGCTAQGLAPARAKPVTNMATAAFCGFIGRAGGESLLRKSHITSILNLLHKQISQLEHNFPYRVRENINISPLTPQSHITTGCSLLLLNRSKISWNVST